MENFRNKDKLFRFNHFINENPLRFELSPKKSS